MKSFKVISFSLFLSSLIYGCIFDSTNEQIINKQYNPYFINQDETFPIAFRYSGVDSLEFMGTRFTFDDSLSTVKYLEFLDSDTLEFIGDKNKMKNLKYLYFFAPRMKNLPEDLVDFENLENLTITKLKSLNSFPNFICELNKLKSLTFAWGKSLDSIPECIGNLKGLEYLDLARNKISRIPRTIAFLKNLKTLILWDNPIPESELKELEKLLPNTTIYFKTTPY
jgi:Leucine-rich repeat (LRR) protein